MHKVIEFLGNNSAIVSAIVSGVVCLFLPKPMFFKAGQKVGDKIPKNVLKIINERIDSFQAGLENKSHEGRKEIISNDQLKNETEKLKVDLGLGKSD